jgi:hypothetical protein
MTTGADLDRLRRAAADLAALSDAWSAGLGTAAGGLHAGSRLAGVTADLLDTAGNG